MRWTDLPADGGAADGDPSGLRRAQWERLRQRLERLPAGHPSSLGEEADEDAWHDDSGQQGDPGEGLDPGGAAGEGSEPPAGSDDPAAGSRPEGGGRPARRGGNDRGGDDAATRRSGQGDESPSPGAAGAGHREPYRPWFAAGEPADPWFASGAESGLSSPRRDRG